MKLKVLFLLTMLSMISLSTFSQRGVRIGYIDTEYILENVPEYQEATSQLESKVQKWKNEIETQLTAIEQRRKDLGNEKALLTKELIEEREEDLVFEEKEILDYQQKRFGPNGDLMIQKKQLIQPIQDQIFAAVQDIAAKKKYDFVAANIITQDLIQMGSRLVKLVKPGKYLAVSGISLNSYSAFRKAFDKFPLHCLKIEKGEGWVALLYKKKDN